MKLRKIWIVVSAVFATLVFTASSSSVSAATVTDSKLLSSTKLKRELLAGEITHNVEKIDKKNYHVTRALLATNPEHIWSYLTDYNKAPDVFTNLNKIRLLDKKDNKKKVEFQVSSLGGLMKFDYVLHITESAPHHIEWQRASGAFKTNEGFWILKPVMDGKYTLVTYGKYVDGGLFLPKMIVDRQLKGTMPQIVRNLKLQVDKDKRRIAQK